MSERAIYKFSGEFAAEILKALGLEGRRIKKIRIEAEVGQPVTLYTEEYATFDTGEPYLMAEILQLAQWEKPGGDAGSA